MSIAMPPDSDWPDAWVMPDTVTEPCQENRQDPNVPVSASDLKKLGICYWKMEDVDKYEYPMRAVPWDPNDVTDPKLKALRDSRGYSYADIITIHPDQLPDFEAKIAAFYEEHIHDAEEIRYLLDGSGYFDVRNLEDKWVRINIKKGDMITLPEGIYHRFACDKGRMCKVMRLFIGQPIWTPFNRPQEEHPSRKKYVLEFSAEEKKEEQSP